MQPHSRSGAYKRAVGRKEGEREAVGRARGIKGCINVSTLLPLSGKRLWRKSRFRKKS